MNDSPKIFNKNHKVDSSGSSLLLGNSGSFDRYATVLQLLEEVSWWMSDAMIRPRCPNEQPQNLPELHK